jgi:AAA+ ATPase superfamily predicted ATPase
LYGITGGIPFYLSLIDRDLSVGGNIKRHFLSSTGYLFEEPGNLLKQECREPAQYNAIIKAVANGASRLSEIAGKTGLETSICATYAAKLISIGILKKELPFREKSSKKSIYRLDDGMFRFWYRFIPDLLPLISRGEPDLAYEQIQSQISAYMGAVFEGICEQYLWQENIARKAPILFTDAGRWWGNNPIKREECEIDIIADNGADAIFCECKWTNDPVGADVLASLIEKSAMFRYDNKHYFLFAKTGFTEAVKAEASLLGNVSLVRFEEF